MTFCSQDLINVCARVQQNIRLAAKESGSNMFLKMVSEDFLLTTSMIQILNSSTFDSLNLHNRNPNFLKNYSVQLIRSNIRKYIKNRFYFIRKNAAKQSYSNMPITSYQVINFRFYLVHKFKFMYSWISTVYYVM